MSPARPQIVLIESKLGMTFLKSLTFGTISNYMDLIPIEEAIIKLIRETKFGSIEIHFKDKEIIWIDQHRRRSPEHLRGEFDTPKLNL